MYKSVKRPSVEHLKSIYTLNAYIARRKRHGTRNNHVSIFHESQFTHSALPSASYLVRSNTWL